MSSYSSGAVRCEVEIERWPLAKPFRTTGHTREVVDVLVVTLTSQGLRGRGEATGVRYRGETAASMLTQIETVRAAIEAGPGRGALRKLLPAGGARNAVDCAMWDLEAKLARRSAYEIAGLVRVEALSTVVTCGADDPLQMAAAARAYRGMRAIKIKLTGEHIDADRVRAIREARPDAWLSVDANQGFTGEHFERLLPTLVAAGVQLIEQPFPADADALLDGFDCPIPIAADESVQTAPDLQALRSRYDVVNIKLDKCGGLTEGLLLARTAHELGLKTWVGNMVGTSLAMAPAYLLGHLCNYVELDGPLFLARDRSFGVSYDESTIRCPQALWGAAEV